MHKKQEGGFQPKTQREGTISWGDDISNGKSQKDLSKVANHNSNTYNTCGKRNNHV